MLQRGLDSSQDREEARAAALPPLPGSASPPPAGAAAAGAPRAGAGEEGAA